MSKKKEFTTITLDPEHKTLIIYLASIIGFDLSVYLSCRSLIASLILDKTLTIILVMTILTAKIFTIVTTYFLLQDKLGKTDYFKKLFVGWR